MKRCYQLAQIAHTHGESAVGSVVVSEDRVIGEGIEQSRKLNDVSRHAEVVAMLDALAKGESLKNSTLYTNVEPCVLCSYVIRQNGIARVVYDRKAGELGGIAGRFRILTAREIDSWNNPPKIEKLHVDASSE